MKLSLSVRVGEKYTDKREAAIPMDELADIAVASGYHAICMRASQISIHSPREDVVSKSRLLRERRLSGSMVTGDFPIPENTDEGPQALRNIEPYLDLAEALGSHLVRVALRKDEDIVWAQRAADAARERGIKLTHQCHNRSLFERVDETLDVLRRISRTNFGLTYEPANLECCGQIYGGETLKRFAPHLVNVYLQNQRLNPAGQSVMKTWCCGDVPFDQIPLWDNSGIDYSASGCAHHAARGCRQERAISPLDRAFRTSRRRGEFERLGMKAVSAIGHVPKMQIRPPLCSLKNAASC